MLHRTYTFVPFAPGRTRLGVERLSDVARGGARVQVRAQVRLEGKQARPPTPSVDVPGFSGAGVYMVCSAVGAHKKTLGR